MEKQRVCKICSKRFSNGKAMGGHMRSHLAKLPVPPKPNPNPTPPPFISRPSPSSSSSFTLNHTKKLLFNVHPHRSSTSDYSPAAHSDLSVQDRESETDSHPKNPTRKRSKRCRDRADDDDQTEPVSSVTEAFSTEDVALCLLMMSRDRRAKVEAKKENDFAFDSEDDDDDKSVSDSDSDSESLICRHEKKHGRRGKFKCKTCNKMFRSYQALGGHKASHKKVNNNGLTDHQMYENGNKLGVVHRRVFKCPFCPREFESGQALGGHKKIHFSHLGNVKNISPPAKFCKISIDLNRPAPGYDEDDDDNDDDEDVVSTISNATKLIVTHHR